jgi:hypothetical protein
LHCAQAARAYATGMSGRSPRKRLVKFCTKRLRGNVMGWLHSDSDPGPRTTARGVRVRATCHYGRILFSGLALIRVGDFDDMQGLIKISGGLPPFSSVKGEDRVDGHIRASQVPSD